jgi:hypothetical protein
MGKLIAVAFGGIFLGALAMEILNRTKPGLTKAIEEKAKQVADTFTKGFNDGWAGKGAEAESAQPEPAPT